MSRMLAWTAVGLTAACLMLAAPTTSQAQGFGPDCGYGGYNGYRGGYSGGYGAGYGNFRSGSYFNGGNGGYDGYRGGNGGYGSGYGGYGRPVIVHPERLHWTPGRGLHEHGHLHVPHRGHYHTIPY